MKVWLILLSSLYGSSLGAPQREVIVTIQTKKWSHILNEKFLSLTLSPDVALQFQDFSAKTLNMLKGMSPAILRLGGPETDKMKFLPTGNSTDNHTISEVQWERLNQFAEDAGLDLFICLNANERTYGVWESKGALELIFASDKNGYNLGWQLGYENQNLIKEGVSGVELGRDVIRLRKILDSFPRYANSPIIGPDVVSLSTPEEIRFIKEYLNESSDALSAITWHPQFSRIKPEDEDISQKFLQLIQEMESIIWNKEASSKQASRPLPKKQIWIAESKPEEYTGGFSDALLWAKRLGTTAQFGFPIIMKQLTANSLTDPTPDFWVSLLFKSLVGRAVLDLKYFMGNRTSLQVFSHCTAVSTDDEASNVLDSDFEYSPGAITVYGVNPAQEPVKLTLRANGKDEPIHIYVLTTDDEHQEKGTAQRNSTPTLLNGHKLALSTIGTLPVLSPKVKKASRTLSVNIPGRSVYFLVLPELRVRTCMSYQLSAPSADEKDNEILSRRFRLTSALVADATKQDTVEKKSSENVSYEYEDDPENGYVKFGTKEKKTSKFDSKEEKEGDNNTYSSNGNYKLTKYKSKKVDPMSESDKKLEVAKSLKSRNVISLKDKLQKSISDKLSVRKPLTIGGLQKSKPNDKGKEAGTEQAVSNTRFIMFSDDDWMSSFAEAKEAVETAKKAIEDLEEVENEVQGSQTPSSTTEQYHPSQGKVTRSARRKKYALLTAAVFGKRNVNGKNVNDDIESNNGSIAVDAADSVYEKKISYNSDGETASSVEGRVNRKERNALDGLSLGVGSDFVPVASSPVSKLKMKIADSNRLSTITKPRQSSLGKADKVISLIENENAKASAYPDFPTGDVYMRASSDRSGEKTSDYDSIDEDEKEGRKADKTRTTEDAESLNRNGFYRPGEFYEHKKLEKIAANNRNPNYDELSEAEFKGYNEGEGFYDCAKCKDRSSFSIVAETKQDETNDRRLNEKVASNLNKYYEGAGSRGALMEEITDYDDTRANDDEEYEKKQKSVYSSLSKVDPTYKHMRKNERNQNSNENTERKTTSDRRTFNCEQCQRQIGQSEEDVSASWETAKEILDNLPSERTGCPNCHGFPEKQSPLDGINLHPSAYNFKSNGYNRYKRQQPDILSIEETKNKKNLLETEPTFDQLQQFLDELAEKERQLSSILDETSKAIIIPREVLFLSKTEDMFSTSSLPPPPVNSYSSPVESLSKNINNEENMNNYYSTSEHTPAVFDDLSTDEIDKKVDHRESEVIKKLTKPSQSSTPDPEEQSKIEITDNFETNMNDTVDTITTIASDQFIKNVENNELQTTTENAFSLSKDEDIESTPQIVVRFNDSENDLKSNHSTTMLQNKTDIVGDTLVDDVQVTTTLVNENHVENNKEIIENITMTENKSEDNSKNITQNESTVAETPIDNKLDNPNKTNPITTTTISPKSFFTKNRLERIEAIRNRLAESRKKLQRLEKKRTNEIGQMSNVQRREAILEDGNENKNNIQKDSGLAYLEEGAPTCKASRAAPYVEGLENLLGEKLLLRDNNVRQRRLSFENGENKLHNSDAKVDRELNPSNTAENWKEGSAFANESETSESSRTKYQTENETNHFKPNIEQRETIQGAPHTPKENDAHTSKDPIMRDNHLGLDSIKEEENGMFYNGATEHDSNNENQFRNAMNYRETSSGSQNNRKFHRFYLPVLNGKPGNFRHSEIELPKGLYSVPIHKDSGYDSSEKSDTGYRIRYPRLDGTGKKGNNRSPKVDNSEEDYSSEGRTRIHKYPRKYISLPYDDYGDEEYVGKDTDALSLQVIPVVALTSPGLNDRMVRFKFRNHNREKRSTNSNEGSTSSSYGATRLKRTLKENDITKSMNVEMYNFASGENRLFVRSPKIKATKSNTIKQMTSSGTGSGTLNLLPQRKRYVREAAIVKNLDKPDNLVIHPFHVRTNEIPRDGKFLTEDKVHGDSFESDLLENKYRLTLSEFKKKLEELKNSHPKNESTKFKYFTNMKADDAKMENNQHVHQDSIENVKESKSVIDNKGNTDFKYSKEENENNAEELMDKENSVEQNSQSKEIYFQTERNQHERNPNVVESISIEQHLTNLILHPLLDFFHTLMKSLVF